MSDIMPNLEINLMEKEISLDNMRLKIKTCAFNKMKLLDQIKGLDQNIEATKIEIKKLETELKEIKQNG